MAYREQLLYTYGFPNVKPEEILNQYGVYPQRDHPIASQRNIGHPEKTNQPTVFSVRCDYLIPLDQEVYLNVKWDTYFPATQLHNPQLSADSICEITLRPISELPPIEILRAKLAYCLRRLLL